MKYRIYLIKDIKAWDDNSAFDEAIIQRNVHGFDGIFKIEKL